ncbi:MAG: winged helix-turn-helix domain-containing protein [Acidobacteria bacterium]|nr:winged helix-turn-helix domain-containing protein [Acidobacteriota bacterium]
MAAHKLILPPPEFSDDPRWALVQRIAASRHFAKATQLHDFLLYITARSLEGREDEVHEFNIGCAVLGRDEGFLPSEDNIVRVQARHLRKKVEDYFSNEGQGEPLLLTIPKGGYVPRFEPRVVTARGEEQEHKAGQQMAAGMEAVHPWRWALAGLAVGLLIAACVGLVVWARPIKPANPFLSVLFREGQETNIVVADSCLVAIQDLLKTDITLDEYTAPEFHENMLARAPDPSMKAVVQKLFSRQYTSLGDLNIASRLWREAGGYPGAARLRFARHVGLREFKTSNFILLGSRRGIPWDGLFETKLHFKPIWDAERGRFFFRRQSARAGEPAEYETDGRKQETFATIVLMPNLDRSGYVLRLTGLTMEGTEAMGELVLRSDADPRLLGVLEKARTGQGEFLEVLVRVSSVGGAGTAPQILAVMTGPAS